MSLKILFCLAFLLAVCAPALAQKPTSPAETKLVYKPVKWAFPAPDLESVDIDGKVYYQLAPEVFGKRGAFDNGLETAVILFSPKMVRMTKLMEVSGQIADTQQFLAGVAVLKAVHTPEGYSNELLGSGKVDGLLVYFYRTKSGANVGAHVDSDGRKVLVMQAPSEP